MNDQTTIKDNALAQGGRTIVILVDSLRPAEEGGGAFSPGTEGLFLLRLGALLASGAGGRLVALKLVAVPEGESLSAYSTRAQELRRELERDMLAALTTGGDAVSQVPDGSGNGAVAPGAAHQ